MAGFHAQPLANFFPVDIFKEHKAENFPVFRRQFVQYCPDDSLPLIGNKRTLDINGAIRNIRRLLHGLRGPGGLATQFQQHVIADRVHEGAKTFGMGDARTLAQDLENTEEGFLADVGGGIRIDSAVPQFEGQKLMKVGVEVPFGLRVTCR